MLLNFFPSLLWGSKVLWRHLKAKDDSENEQSISQAKHSSQIFTAREFTRRKALYFFRETAAFEEVFK